MERKSIVDLILDHVEAFVFALVIGVLVIIFLAFLQGCRPKQCTTLGATRCKGDLVEVCSSGYTWKRISDCRDYGGRCVMEHVEDSTSYQGGKGSHDVAICVPPDVYDATATH